MAGDYPRPAAPPARGANEARKPMQARRRTQDTAPPQTEDSQTAPAPIAVKPSAADPARQAAWKQSWLNQADRRGAIWHAQWKNALEAKRTARPDAGKGKKT